VATSTHALHDALPICCGCCCRRRSDAWCHDAGAVRRRDPVPGPAPVDASGDCLLSGETGMSGKKAKPPLVYSCSGCSSAAQMANQLALWLDREGAAEMSCIAGVGGGVTGLVRTAQAGRPILALDGCV